MAGGWKTLHMDDLVPTPGGEEWSGAALRYARERRCHSQTECGAEIGRLGGTRVTQSTVYSWEKSRTTPGTANLGAALAYCHAELPLPADRMTDDLPPTSRNHPGVDIVDCLVHPLTGERELSPRQAALVDRIIDGAGTFSEVDSKLLAAAARVLGLGDYFD